MVSCSCNRIFLKKTIPFSFWWWFLYPCRSFLISYSLICLFFSFMSLALEGISSKILLCGISEILLPMFSSRTFMVSQLIYKSFIHFEFILVCGVSWRSSAQVANTRPAGWIRPSILFYRTWHLVSTPRQHHAPCPYLRSSYIYTVLKWHSAIWRQLQGWCGPWWKWVWHSWSTVFFFFFLFIPFQFSKHHLLKRPFLLHCMLVFHILYMDHIVFVFLWLAYII